MKQSICYLYEYQEYNKTKNVGFLKCIFLKDKVTFQIHGKGLDCDKLMDLEMFLFTSNEEECNIDRVGDVEGTQGKVDYMVTVENLDANGMKVYDGVLLESRNHKQYIATWKQKDVRISPEDVRVSKLEKQESDCVEECIYTEEDSCIEDIGSEEECRCIEEVSVIEESRCIQQVSDTEETSYIEGLSSTEDVECEEDKKRIVVDDFTYEKIDRHGLSVLPHREWKLANNNFLLHGYKNYKHLMFIRDKDKLYLGVPGVYHSKEESAAKSFGFSLFHTVDAKQLKLSDAESNNRNRFGYWCRPVTELKRVNTRDEHGNEDGNDGGNDRTEYTR